VELHTTVSIARVRGWQICHTNFVPFEKVLVYIQYILSVSHSFMIQSKNERARSNANQTQYIPHIEATYGERMPCQQPKLGLRTWANHHLASEMQKKTKRSIANHPPFLVVVNIQHKKS
jgi:hypothetical protein